MAHLEFFSEDRIELMKEVRNHPDLMEILSQAEEVNFEVQLAQIAAHCGVAIDGLFYKEDIDAICEMLVWKLRQRRIGIILPY